jgi:hypothetical protein
MPQTNESGSRPPTTHNEEEWTIDFRDIFRRIGRGLAPTLGLLVLGLAIGVGIELMISPTQPVTTSTRVVFSFRGYEKGEYPDHSKFNPDDLRAPSVIAEAVHRQGLQNRANIETHIRSALNIEGIIPADVLKQHDRLRAAGQPLPPYLPDEYAFTLRLNRNFPLSSRERELLLNEIVSVYRGNFLRTHASLPPAFGNAFQSLRNADPFEYELVLGAEAQGLISYLYQQIEKADAFRSSTTNFSFGDLLRQAQLFAQVRLSETLGLIRRNGLSHDRAATLVKIDYYLQNLEADEKTAVEEESVVQNLLTKVQDRKQDYVMTVKSQATRTEGPVVDQSLVDSLLANDSYSFLVRKALDAGLKVKRVQAEKNLWMERKKTMEEFIHGSAPDQSKIVTQVDKSLSILESTYSDLISNIRRTYEDYAQQQFGNAIRVSDSITTEGIARNVAMAGLLGGALGLALGIGLSLLGVYPGLKRST